MIWLLYILVFLCALLLWFLIAPLVLEIDSRKPIASIKWISIGKIVIWHDDEWWLSFRIFFFHKKMRLSSIKKRRKGPYRINKRIKRKPKNLLMKIIRVMRTFRIEEWQLAIDTGDYASNAQIYPFNFFPKLRHHLQVNFNDENYLYIRIRNRPLKIFYAYLR
jgi:uncharacterized membrane protein YbhN (UPF0104 family)